MRSRALLNSFPGREKSEVPDFELIYRHDERWHRAIRHTAKGEVQELEALIDDGLILQALFSPTVQKSAEAGMPVSRDEIMDHEGCWIDRPESLLDEAYEDEGVRIGLMHVAAQHNQIEAMKLLLGRGAEADRVACTHYHGDELSPLFYAVRHGSLEAAHFLLDAGASLAWNWAENCTLLDATMSDYWKGPNVYDRRKQMVVLLLDHGVDIHGRSPDCLNLLMQKAVLHNHLDIAIELCSRGASCDGTLGHFVRGRGSDELLDLLIANRATGLTDIRFWQIGPVDTGGRDLFIRILERCDLSMYTREELARSFVRFASDGLSDACKLLVTRGVDVNSRSRLGVTAVHVASRHGDLELVDWLLRRRAVFDSLALLDGRRDARRPISALKLALYECHLTVANRLIIAGAEVNGVRGGQGLTALMYLCGAPRLDTCSMPDVLDTVDKLILAGANLDAKDTKGGSILHHLVLRDRGKMNRLWIADLADALIHRGLTTCIRDNGGKLALDHAREAIPAPDPLLRVLAAHSPGVLDPSDEPFCRI